MSEQIHFGHLLEQLLKEKHKTKTELAKYLGRSVPTMSHLAYRHTYDVQTVQKCGNFLGYNFFKHYPIVESDGEKIVVVESKTFDLRDKQIEELKAKLAECEKITEPLKRDLAMQKQENVYLKKINELLEKK